MMLNDTEQNHAPTSYFSDRTHINYFNNGMQVEQVRRGPGRVASTETIIRLWVVAILIVLFAGIHLLSWDAYFPSALDQRLWRAGTFFILVSGGLYFAWAAGMAVLYTIVLLCRRRAKIGSQPLDQQPRGPRSRNAKLLMKTWTCIFRTFWALYGIARIVMLFICVRTLTHHDLPILAYSTVNWTTLLPHV